MANPITKRDTSEMRTKAHIIDFEKQNPIDRGNRGQNRAVSR